ncbi:ParA family protein [Trichocoleus sp. FACHB-90]|uniref:ParA family protein n=1 Tax=Cyanophyceae TaxID=3028117 RepID=UPI00168446EF|nr:ParA family protein [Trichocoleus sp. FACHB-90]MBD1930139.1 ParA family protein [Trichocoleus sp. FACHB-90]
MKILTVTGYKGGVGKSVTAVHIATFFSDLGKTVLVDGDPNRTALGWNSRGKLPFLVADERQAMKVVSSSDFVIIDTPARPDSDDLKELAKGCDLLVLPTAPDVLSLQPMLETAQDLGDTNYRALITIVPPYPSREGEVMRKDLKEGGVPIFETMIRRTAGFPKAALAGVPIRNLDDARFKAAWADYEALGNEIMEIWNE